MSLVYVNLNIISPTVSFSGDKKPSKSERWNTALFLVAWCRIRTECYQQQCCEHHPWMRKEMMRAIKSSISLEHQDRAAKEHKE